MTPERQRLLDKILKLLALADSTSFAAEAETARKMAADLMVTHNIEPGPGKPSQDTIEWREYIPFAKGMNWELTIACALANFCSCQVFFSEDKTAYALVGSIGNLDMLDYMLREIDRARRFAWINYRAGGPDSFHKFCYGYAVALENKIESLIDPQKTMENYKKLTIWYETNILHAKTNTTNIALGRPSSQAGIEAGQNASLHRGSIGQTFKRLTHK